MIQRIFLDHPASVDETFWQHLRFALTFAAQLLMAACAAAVHAFIPSLFDRTASRIVRDLYMKTSTRGQPAHHAAE